MKLVITSSIYKSEFQFLESVFSLELTKAAAKKSIYGLGERIKTSRKIKMTQLIKVYLTSQGGAGRAIFLLKINVEKAVLVMIRMKHDKQIGMNMSINNPKFKKVLNKNLEMILSDLESGNYEEYEL